MNESISPELQERIDAMTEDYIARPAEERQQQLEGVVTVKSRIETEQRNGKGQKEKIEIGKLMLYDKPTKNVKILRNKYEEDGKQTFGEDGKPVTYLDDKWVLTGSIRSTIDDSVRRCVVIEKFNDLGQHLVRVVSMRDFIAMNSINDHVTPSDIERFRERYMNALWSGETEVSSTAKYIDELFARIDETSTSDGADEPAK